MINVFGDLWTYEVEGKKMWRCITTNGSVKTNGENVMGSGCALEWKKRDPDAPAILGKRLREYGNFVHKFEMLDGTGIVTVPTKEEWFIPSPIETIIRSCKELAEMAEDHPDDIFVLPRPGVGAGKLKWEDVEPVIAEILPDNVHVITWN